MWQAIGAEPIMLQQESLDALTCAEVRNSLGWHRNENAGLGILGRARPPQTRVKAPEAADLYLVTAPDRRSNLIDDELHYGFGLGERQASSQRHLTH